MKSLLICETASGHKQVGGFSLGEGYLSHLNYENDINGNGPQDKIYILAPFDCVVRAIARFDNAVFFESLNYDEHPNGTYKGSFQCAHMDDADFTALGIRIGKIFRQGERCYREGTKGYANGAHIHLTQARGTYAGSGTTSPYTSDGRTYVINGKTYRHYDINATGAKQHIYDFFYLDPEVPLVNGMSDIVKTYIWRYAGVNMEIKDGYSYQLYGGQKIHTYKMTGNEKLGLIACPMYQTKDIREFSVPGWKIKAIVNASYFVMNHNSPDFNRYLGRVQGVECGTGKRVDERTNKPSSGDKPFMDLVITKSGKVIVDDMNSWDYPGEEVMLGVAPAGVEILDGLYVNKYSPECGYNKIISPNTQTALVKCPDGKFALVAVSGTLAPVPDLQTWALACGCTEMSIYDSGGSTQMLVYNENGIPEKKVYTGRHIPVCLAIYEDGEYKSDSENSKWSDAEAKGEIYCAKSALNVRADLKFSLGRNFEKVLKTAKKGESLELLDMIDGIQADGYQWARVRFDGVEGYSQYDSKVYVLRLK